MALNAGWTSQPSSNRLIILVPFHPVESSGSSLEQTHSRSGIALSACHASTSNISVVLLNELFSTIPHLVLDPEIHFTAKDMKTTGSRNSMVL